MESPIRPEFQQHEFNAAGADTVDEILAGFSVLLGTVERLVPQSRERAFVVTKLQEACDWAVRGAATPEHIIE